MSKDNPIFATIKRDITDNRVVLYMKGRPDAPQCGFSSTVCQILKRLNVPFKGIDVLADMQLRDAIKEYTDWPTIPQLYIDGEFIGGCDIVREMFSNGELLDLCNKKQLVANT